MLGFGPLGASALGEMPEVIPTTPNTPSITIQAVVTPIADHPDGQIVVAIPNIWREVAVMLGADWSSAFTIPPRAWEELIAATFDKAGYDEVILTPRSNDFGRDVIATKSGVGSVRIIGSVKAKAPGNLVSYDDVRALGLVLLSDRAASKGIITTTTDFPPNMLADRFIAPLVPTRLELLNGEALRKWMIELLGGSGAK